MAAPPSTSVAVHVVGRAPSREEVDSKVGEMQSKLAELKRLQLDLERERSALEDTRRRQAELATSREEMVHNITRGIGLLEEGEFGHRRDAEQMSKSLADLREALTKVQAIQEETWTKENLNVELTRALTVLENARMEWNSTRMKFPVLSGAAASDSANVPPASQPMQELMRQRNYAELCKMGLALTWPVALVGLGLVLVLLMRHG